MVRKLGTVLLLLFVTQLLLSSLLLFLLFRFETEQMLERKITRVQENITYDGVTWNIDTYNSDPDLIGVYPLYILTNNGFVLDRRSPITNFLDSSDFNKLLEYQTIATLESITGNKRRIYSLPIQDRNGQINGVITVSYFNPSEENTASIDDLLYDTASRIRSRVQLDAGKVDVSRVDEKEIPYEISFIIVDQYNSVLHKSTNVNNIKRIPNFIDPSYVRNQLQDEGTRFVRDGRTGQVFLVMTKPLLSNNTQVGVIVIGEGARLELLGIFSLLFAIVNGVVLCGVGLLLKHSLFKDLQPSKEGPQKIWFSEKESAVYIDHHKIEIAYASNQFYLLKALFAHPTKRFETDELLERFGEFKNEANARKVYDTMANINKKLEGYLKQKLIINQQKTYQLNPMLPLGKSNK